MSFGEGRHNVENNKKWILAIIGALLLGAGLVASGIVIGQQITNGPTVARAADTTDTYGPRMMGYGYDGDDDDGDDYPYRMGPGMMGRGGYGMHGYGGFGPGHMWDDDGGPGWRGYGMMGGEYQDAMHTAIAEVLGLSVEDLEQAMWEEGKSMWQLAEEQGLSEDAFFTAMQDAHDAVLAQMVDDGVITQEQADWMSEHMAEGPYGPGHCPGWQTAPDDNGVDA